MPSVLATLTDEAELVLGSKSVEMNKVKSKAWIKFQTLHNMLRRTIVLWIVICPSDRDFKPLGAYHQE